MILNGWTTRTIRTVRTKGFYNPSFGFIWMHFSSFPSRRYLLAKGDDLESGHPILIKHRNSPSARTLIFLCHKHDRDRKGGAISQPRLQRGSCVLDELPPELPPKSHKAKQARAKEP